MNRRGQKDLNTASRLPHASRALSPSRRDGRPVPPGLPLHPHHKEVQEYQKGKSDNECSEVRVRSEGEDSVHCRFFVPYMPLGQSVLLEGKVTVSLARLTGLSCSRVGLFHLRAEVQPFPVFVPMSGVEHEPTPAGTARRQSRVGSPPTEGPEPCVLGAARCRSARPFSGVGSVTMP